MADYIILPPAKAEYDEAFDHYARSNPVAAERFESAIDRALQTISATPELWPPHGDRHRFYKLKKFPYIIYYRYESGQVTIVAVAHTSRQLDYWMGR
jgi:plasmid stabilization system protein ParE